MQLQSRRRIRQPRRRARRSRSGPTSIMSAALGAMATTNIWFGVGAPAERFVDPRGASLLARTNCGRRPASRPSFGRRARRPIASGISRRRATGRPMTSRPTAKAGPMPRSPRLTSASKTISSGGRWARRSPFDAGTDWALGLSAVLEEKRRHQILLGARSRRRQARFPRRRLLRRAASLDRRHDPVRNRPPARRRRSCASPLEGKRVALLAHPASVTRDLTHSLDALVAAGLNVSAVFGPQHGVRGDMQDNMVESPDFTDPIYGIPVFSLYGEVRRPTGQSMGTFDTILIDLQDLGCRIYTLRHDAALRARGGGGARQERVGARPAQSRRPPGRGTDAAPGLGKLRRRRADADAPRPDAGRARPLVRRRISSSTSIIG